MCETPLGITVCLVASSVPELGDNPKRLPLLAVKVSTGKAIEKGIDYYLTSPWKEAWDGWLKAAVKEFPSVLEHVTFTFFIDGCSRVCSHQLVRHRLASFTQESQRYTESRVLKALEEEGIRCNDLCCYHHELLELMVKEGGSGSVERIVRRLFVLPRTDEELILSLAGSLADYLYFRCHGMKMEDARFVLSQAVKTSLLVTMNLRELMHIVSVRDHPRAQWEIREVARAMKRLAEKKLNIELENF